VLTTCTLFKQDLYNLQMVLLPINCLSNKGEYIKVAAQVNVLNLYQLHESEL